MASSMQWTIALKQATPTMDLSEHQLAELHNACFEGLGFRLRKRLEEGHNIGLLRC